MERLIQIGPFTRIFLTLLIAAAVYFPLRSLLSWRTDLLIAWCAGALFFLGQVATMFSLLDAEGVKRRCQRQKSEGHGPMLAGVILTSLVSIAAVIYLLDDVRPEHGFYKLHLGFSLVSIFSSWFIMQAMFAIYYARNYYKKSSAPAAKDGLTGGLRFTTEEAPDYWDFLYFSLTLAMCYGVSDILITSKFIRRVAMLQTLLSFFYYTVIIGLVMNVIGTLF